MRQLRLRAVIVAVEDVHLVAALHAHQRGEQPDRSGAGDQRAARRRGFEPPHAIDVVPRLGDHARRLEQHAEQAERAIDFHGELRRRAPALGAEAVQSLDAVLGVLPVAAHVPLAGRAGRAGQRVGMAHDADHVIAGREVGFLRRRDHPAERLMPEDQAIVAVGRRAELARDDLAIGAAHAERERLHQHRTVRCRRFRYLVQPYRIGGLGKDRDGAQGKASSAAHRDDALPAEKFRAACATSVMAGHSPSKTGVNALMLGHPRLASSRSRRGCPA